MPRNNGFSNSEMADMIAVYCQEHFNGGAAARTYSELYPERHQPNRKLFQVLFQRLRDTGSFRVKCYGGRPPAGTIDEEENVLERVEENPEISVRRLSAVTGIPQTRVHKILKTELLHPYHHTRVQDLLPQDLPTRLHFCRWLLNEHNNDSTFLSRVLFTDEATFTRRGMLNTRNSHTWSDENPHVAKTTHFQHEFSVNVWCGIIGDHLLGPYELPTRLNAESYLNFLEHVLPTLLENIPLNLRLSLWFMHDGAPAHYGQNVRNYLNNCFSGRWIGRGSDHIWPPRSPDLNPLDFFLWGYMKDIVYQRPSNSREELLIKIRAAGNEIKNRSELFFRVQQNLRKRVQKCIDVDGEHFENFL